MSFKHGKTFFGFMIGAGLLFIGCSTTTKEKAINAMAATKEKIYKADAWIKENLW